MPSHCISLMEAARKGCIECVKLHIPCGGGLMDREGNTALMEAAKNGHTECAKLLIDKEARIQDAFGKSALMWAAMTDNIECVELLIDKEVGLKDIGRRTALMWAAANDSPECVKLLMNKEVGLQDNEGKSALMHAAENDSPDCVKLLIPHEAGLLDECDMTALMWAAGNGYPECVIFLMDKEDASLRDKDGKTAYDYAIEYNKYECARILRNYNNNSLFSLIFLPNIPIGSFLDILNKAAKQSDDDYDDSMVEISNKLEKLSVSVLQEYLAIHDIKILESRLINDFPEYKEKIPSIIKELETEELTCPVCLDESVQMYRNCINCTGFACKECWREMNNCMICKSALYWEKCLNLEVLQKT